MKVGETAKLGGLSDEKLGVGETELGGDGGDVHDGRKGDDEEFGFRISKENI